MVIGVFFTGCALILALGCGVLFVFCLEASRECRDQAADLRKQSSRLLKLEHESEALSGLLHKLRQKVYSLKPEKQEIEIARTSEAWPACENWLEAQTAGPSSQAAKCACDYCISKRNDRDAARAKLVPKTNSERRDAIEKARRN